MTTLAKDPHGDVDEAQFIDASKLVSRDTKTVPCSYRLAWKITQTSGLLDNSCYHAQPHPIVNCGQ